MVRILEFRPRESWAGPRRPESTAGTVRRNQAEIIIFPGVRIERKPVDDGGGDTPSPYVGRARSPAQGKK